MCPHCRAFITTKDRVCPYCGEAIGERAVEARNPTDLVGGLIPHARLVTSMLLLVNIGLFVATYLYGSGHDSGQALIAFGGMYRPAIFIQHQWWRLVTAGFLHSGLLHILMNSWVLMDLGSEVEQIYGKPRMIVYYFVATVAGFYLSYRLGSGMSVGSSAGITGLLGAMVALGVRNRTSVGRAIRNHYLRWAAYILVIGLVVRGIDNYAHIGGFVAGFVIAYLGARAHPVNGGARIDVERGRWSLPVGHGLLFF